MNDFHPHSPAIKYVQNVENNYILSSLDSNFFAVNEHVSGHAVLSRLSLSL